MYLYTICIYIYIYFYRHTMIYGNIQKKHHIFVGFLSVLSFSFIPPGGPLFGSWRRETSPETLGGKFVLVEKTRFDGWWLFLEDWWWTMMMWEGWRIYMIIYCEISRVGHFQGVLQCVYNKRWFRGLHGYTWLGRPEMTRFLLKQVDWTHWVFFFFSDVSEGMLLQQWHSF